MATETVTECDVFGTTRGVSKVTVGVTVDGELQPTLNESRDLSPRALMRLVKMIKRGLAPAKRKAEAE